MSLQAPAGSTASWTRTPQLPTQGEPSACCHFVPGMFLSMDDTLISFFRALSQDDQDDIHLKLEDIIQLVSPAMVLFSTIICKLPLRGKQLAHN